MHTVKRHRRSIRLRGFDYRQPGEYFVTIVTKDRLGLFGEIVNGEVKLNLLGEIVSGCWRAIPSHFSHVAVDGDDFVVMPNHIHGILSVVGARHAVPLPASFERFGTPLVGSIPTIVRSFKSTVTKQINELRHTPGVPIWQRNYYEHVIRNENESGRIREYIANNPLQWEFDRENPSQSRNGSPKGGEPWET